MNKFRTDDIVIDDYNRKGIVIGYHPCRHDTILLLIKSGYYYNTLESLEYNWKYVDHYDEFENILDELEA